MLEGRVDHMFRTKLVSRAVQATKRLTSVLGAMNRHELVQYDSITQILKYNTKAFISLYQKGPLALVNNKDYL